MKLLINFVKEFEQNGSIIFLNNKKQFDNFFASKGRDCETKRPGLGATENPGLGATNVKTKQEMKLKCNVTNKV